MEKQLIFALDIGTRSVIGVVCAEAGEGFEVLCVESAEHTERAMIDGQIEDIDKTARVARAVKEAIEQKLGAPLSDVHVAAAGRILRTRKASFEMEMGDLPINRKQMFTLESRAVQKAFEELMADRQDEIVFCCAGYSVTQYSLDGYTFSTLLGHRGKKARVEIIASFLPDEVIESLYTTMEKTGLRVASVTLEPIAAMNAVIPRELRLLNIALVDIGAGTSDIAISNQGSVVAYTMSTVAGDEITEQVMREFLVDFETAERLKREAGLEQNDPLRYTDILGSSYEVPRAEFLQKLEPAVGQLAESIAQKVLEANGGPPTATFLVGGGSRTPGLRAAVAAALGADEKKVAVGGINYIKRSVRADEQYLSVEYATPVGIAITAIQSGDQREMTVQLNGKPVRMLNNSTLRVVDVLMRGGYEYRRIMGHSGQPLVYTLNGETKKLRGGIPTLARIEVNGAPAGITSPVQEGDKILFRPAQDGADAAATVAGALEAAGGQPTETFTVELFGSARRMGLRVWVNGEPAGPDYQIRTGDIIETGYAGTLGALLEEESLAADPAELSLNGESCTEEDPLKEGDVIGLMVLPALPEETPAQQGAAPGREPLPVTGRAAGMLRLSINGRQMTLPPKSDGQPYQLFDLLNFVTDINLDEPQGRAVLRKNGQEVSFLEPIGEGDEVRIYWE